VPQGFLGSFSLTEQAQVPVSWTACFFTIGCLLTMDLRISRRSWHVPLTTKVVAAVDTSFEGIDGDGASPSSA
jgi:hypothetical protein